MDEFINPLNTGRFESTNGLWNELMLNDPWSVGYVTTLIETTEFRTKEEWEAFYYHSGELRNVKLSALASTTKALLNDEQLVRRNKPAIRQLDWSLKNLNYQFGRTHGQLQCKGTILYQAALQRRLPITEAECIEAVRFRTICQTWNGVVVRERKAIVLLQEQLPQVRFEKTAGETDYEFAVDYQLYAGNRLLCGIQIKPASYGCSKAPYVVNARAANKRKNNQYHQRFGVPVFDVLYEKGQLINGQVTDNISRLLKLIS
jgi:hypothetical protein